MFQTIVDFYKQHPYWATYISFTLINAAVSSMSSPTTGSSGFYKWFYGFSKTILGAVFSVARMKNLPMATDVEGVTVQDNRSPQSPAAGLSYSVQVPATNPYSILATKDPVTVGVVTGK
jgi:hypothetical protein